MFRGKVRSISREEIAVALGVDLNDTRLHEMAYPGAEPPRRAPVGGVLPSCAGVAICYRQSFLPESSRAPRDLQLRLWLCTTPYDVHFFPGWEVERQ